MSDPPTVFAWVVFTASLVLAVAAPWVSHRRLLRPETLPEMYLFSRPGVVIAWHVIALTAVSLVGVGTIAVGLLLDFQPLPVLWGVVVLVGAQLVVLAERLIRYLRFDPSTVGERLPGSDEGTRPVPPPPPP